MNKTMYVVWYRIGKGAGVEVPLYTTDNAKAVDVALAHRLQGTFVRMEIIEPAGRTILREDAWARLCGGAI